MSFGGSSTRSSFGDGGSTKRSSFGGPSTSVTFDISRSVAADSSESRFDGEANPPAKLKSWPFPPHPQRQASDGDGKSIHSSMHSDDADKVSMGKSINSSMRIGMSVEGSGSSGGSSSNHSNLKAPPIDVYDSMNRGHLNMGQGGTRPRLFKESSRTSRESSASGGSAETSGSSGGAVAGPSYRNPPPPLSGGGKVAPAYPPSTVWEGETLGSGRGSVRESEYGGRNNTTSWADIERELYHGNAMPAFSRRSTLDSSDASVTSGGKSLSQPRLPSQVPDRSPVLKRGGNSLSHVGVNEYGRNNKRAPEDNEHESHRRGDNRSTFRGDDRSILRGDDRSILRGDDRSTFRGEDKANFPSTMKATNSQSTTATRNTRYFSHEGIMGRTAGDPSSKPIQHSSHEETRVRKPQITLTNMRGPKGTSGTNTRRVDSSKFVPFFSYVFVTTKLSHILF
jgi:hypothetical protein